MSEDILQRTIFLSSISFSYKLLTPRKIISSCGSIRISSMFGSVIINSPLSSLLVLGGSGEKKDNCSCVAVVLLTRAITANYLLHER